MTVETAGPIRGFLGRWVMRFEAAGQILTMTFQGTTAVSALSGVLAYTGLQQYVPLVLVVGILFVFGFAFVYVEYGVYNRKNREKHDRGSNYAGPTMRIDDEMIGVAVYAAMHGEEPDEDDVETISNAVDTNWSKYRNGVQIE